MVKKAAINAALRATKPRLAGTKWEMARSEEVIESELRSGLDCLIRTLSTGTPTHARDQMANLDSPPPGYSSDEWRELSMVLLLLRSAVGATPLSLG